MSEMNVFPQSFAQELFWHVHRASPESSAYNVPRTRRLHGALDAAALRRAFDAVAARHEILRTTYDSHGEDAVQIVHPATSVPFVEVDLRGESRDQREAEIERLTADAAGRPFDLAREAPLRVLLMRCTDDDYVLHVDGHHIATDGASRDILFRDLAAYYVAQRTGERAELSDLPIQFADYAAWQRRALAGTRLANSLAYWRTEFADMDAAFDLVPDVAAGVRAAATASATLDAADSDALRALARRFDATPYMCVLAGFAALLHRYGGRPDVLVGSPISGRTRAETEDLIGCFLGTLVQRTRFSGDPTFAALLARVRAGALDAYDHADVPFEKLAVELRREGAGDGALVRAMLTVLEPSDASAGRLGDVEIAPYGREAGTTKFDLTLFLSDRPEGVALTLRARGDLLSANATARTLGHLRTLLASAAATPDLPVSRLPLLSAGERATLAAHEGTADPTAAPPVLEAMLAHAARAPGAAAVRCGETVMTYGELLDAARTIASQLGEAGACSGTAVGVLAERAPRTIAAFLGVLLAGAAYVPLDPQMPQARLHVQLAESATQIVVTERSFLGALPANVRAVVLGEAMAEARRPAGDAVPGPEDAAYVLFTSGSTGVPKGVVVTHGNLAHYVRGIGAVLGADRSLEGLQFGTASTLAADLGNTAIYGALCTGGTIHLLPRETTDDPERFAAYVERWPLDVLKMTPGHLRALLPENPAEWRSRLPRRALVLGGEALDLDFASDLAGATDATVLNHYGPTEATVGATCFAVTAASIRVARENRARTVPIGTPLAGTIAAVLDASGETLPLGIPGELYLGGGGVARGYAHRPEFTAERFVEIAGRGRMYRTGDRVRRLGDGALEFLGRGDGQVKIRGFRVDLGDVEHALRVHPQVDAATALVRATSAGEVLAGYVVLRSNASAPASELQAWIAARLPEAMVPTVVVLEKFPLSANGKLDRAALPEPGASGAPPDAYVAPETPTQLAIAAIWAEVLKCERVGLRENFLALGGHSLLAIRILGKLSRAFAVRLPLRILFDTPTVEALAAEIDRRASESAPKTPALTRTARTMHPPPG